MTTSTRMWTGAVVTATALVGFLVYGGVHSPVRTVAVLAFLLLFPGLAWVRLLALADRVMHLMLALAVSLVINAAVPGTMIYLGSWSPRAALGIVFALTLMGAGMETVRGGGEA